MKLVDISKDSMYCLIALKFKDKNPLKAVLSELDALIVHCIQWF